VIIESVLVESQPQDTNSLRAPRLETLTIPPGNERLEIQYTALNFGAPERARFRYRLEGHEKDWIEAGGDRVARYSKLPPGQYRFRVTAANEDGVWNETGSSLALIVQPPFWRTWWFLTTIVVCLLAVIIAVVRYFSVQKLERQLAVLRQQEVLEKERGRIARDIHDQLGASLTQVALLGEMVTSDKHLPDEVESHARQISQTARETTRTLDEIVWTVNPANDTLEGLVNYVCKYAQEFLAVAGLRYRFEVPPELPARPIPPEVRHHVFLAAKEAVTNVVRHAGASSAWVRLKVEPSHFVLEIADDGRGLAGMDEKRAATRHGLSNMRQRMEDIGGEFSLDSAPEGGLRIRFTVPTTPG
jgi:signal transduction histidine kinase